MNYLLDTNVISEMRKDSRMKASSPKMDRRVEEWVKSVSAPDLHLSVISILELERGFHLLIRRDPVQAEVIRLWVRNKVLPSFEGRILAIDLAIARRCAALRDSEPNRIPRLSNRCDRSCARNDGGDTKCAPFCVHRRNRF